MTADVVAFTASQTQFDTIVWWLAGSDAAGLTHAELETSLARDGGELLRRLLQDWVCQLHLAPP